MDTFDSRVLRNTDCFGQRFSRPGTYRYAITRAALGGLSFEAPFSITVGRGGGGGETGQHHVAVRLDGHHLVADPPELKVSVGDFVMWHAPDPTTPPYAVQGEKDFFSSTALRSEAGYSHAFGLPGEYEWRDANGGGPRGVVRVQEVRADTPEARRAWVERLRKGTLVMVNGDSAEPAIVDVVVGQTVFWIVGKAAGVTVTDARLLRDEEPPVEQDERPAKKRPARAAAGKKAKVAKPAKPAATMRSRA